MDYCDDVLKLLTYIFQVHMLFHFYLLVKTQNRQNLRVAKRQGERKRSTPIVKLCFEFSIHISRDFGIVDIN